MPMPQAGMPVHGGMGGAMPMGPQAFAGMLVVLVPWDGMPGCVYRLVMAAGYTLDLLCARLPHEPSHDGDGSWIKSLHGW